MPTVKNIPGRKSYHILIMSMVKEWARGEIFPGNPNLFVC
jgi:hypothetical protein